MNLNPVKAYVSKYALYFKLACIVIVLGVICYGVSTITWKLAENKWSADKAKLVKQISYDAQQLRNAETMLRYAGDAIRLQGDQAQLAMKLEKEANKRAFEAGKAAAHWQAEFLKKNKKFAGKVESARSNKDCDFLLNADIAKVCGL